MSLSKTKKTSLSSFLAALPGERSARAGINTVKFGRSIAPLTPEGALHCAVGSPLGALGVSAGLN